MSYLKKTLLFVLIAGCATNISCVSDKVIGEKFSSQINHISSELVADGTLEILEASLVREDGK